MKTEERRKKISSGLDEIELWMIDLVHGGLARAPDQQPEFWSDIAARMVDCGMPGLARRLRALPSLIDGSEQWPARMLDRLGSIALLAAAARRLDPLALPAPVAADVRAALGLNMRHEPIRALEGIADRWHVLGGLSGAEEGLRWRRTWLWGEESGLPALLLDFVYGRTPFAEAMLPGTSFRGELVYFPGTLPARALVNRALSEPAATGVMPGFSQLDDATDAYAHALGRNPWLEQFPFALRGVIPETTQGRMFLRDRENRSLPLYPGPERFWRLMALSGGDPIDLFGEWDGEALVPLSVVADGRFVPLPSRMEE